MATDPLDDFLPAPLRHTIEARYWAPIGAAATVERFIDDPALHAAPDRHPALFSDHGVVHVRDVAGSAAALAARLHGTLLPPRPAPARHFVQGLAVLLAYFHDIGMAESSAAGRRVHAQFAAQTVLGPDFDDLAAALWQADAAGLRSRLQGLPLALDPAWTAREVMALALAHSKTAVPAPLLDDRARLRQRLQRACFTDLAAQAALGRDATAPGALRARYRDPEAESFAWLDDPRPALQALAGEVIDAVRVLRAADALRQRGTTLRTSAGYEVCTDRATGEAVVGLRTQDERRTLLLRFHNPISAAEANIRVTAITDDGALAVEFYRGRFAGAGVRAALLAVTADVVADIEADALGSFGAAAGRPVRLVAPADDARFADELARLLVQRHPRLAGRTEVEAAAVPATPEPVPGWIAERRLDRPPPDAGTLFERLAAHGLNVDAIDRRAALAGTRCIDVQAGTRLIEPGSTATFVIVPLAPGLLLQPMGGYAAQPLHPWIPLGVTGVARGGERNAGVVADGDVPVLLVDGEHYLAEWFRPYDLDGLRARLRPAA